MSWYVDGHGDAFWVDEPESSGETLEEYLRKRLAEHNKEQLE